LSYVVNGGFARWYAVPLGWNGTGTPGNDGVLRWGASGDLLKANLDIGRKLGVMFLGTHTGDQPWDIKTRPQDITDGASTTLLVGENFWTGHSTGTIYSGGLPTNWACPLPTFAMFLTSDDVCHSAVSTTDCLASQLRPGSSGATGPGWSRANKRGTFENINGKAQVPTEGGHPYISSNHPGGANFVFCDGSVKFLSETIDGTVYAQIITPGGESLPWSLRHGTLNGEDITN
jgi:prepilin-type processing-associated H-X9-DG protein